MHQLYVDFKEAYGSINRQQLCIIMRQIGVPTNIVHLFKLILRKTMNKVQIGGTLADSFDTTSGLRQGDWWDTGRQF